MIPTVGRFFPYPQNFLFVSDRFCDGAKIMQSNTAKNMGNVGAMFVFGGLGFLAVSGGITLVPSCIAIGTGTGMLILSKNILELEVDRLKPLVDRFEKVTFKVNK